jgi:predicted ATPase/tRNA A-37 threonylcarbamoyl transferase component Bud32
MPLAPGTRLGPYEILSAIGAGGMGEVYRARDNRLDRTVAVKLIPQRFSKDPDLRRRLDTEARAISKLSHPNICILHDIGHQDGTDFLVLEYVEGKTLRELMDAGGLPIRKIVPIAVQIAEGLAKAHEAGIIHRDLKPENLMVSPDVVKILDFGLAKLGLEGANQGDTLSMETGSTTPGVILGTFKYMSPEQANGHALDFRSDQFSLGTVLYEIVTGKNPFARVNLPETLIAILREEPAPIASLNPEVPPPFSWVIERCLEKEPEKRYFSTRDLVRDLVAIRDRLTDLQAVRTEERPSNLPAPGTVLIGRENEMVAVKQLLLRREVRLVTVTGPGGIGKSHFATEVAREVTEHFPFGVYFVPLASISDASVIPSVIAQTLGVRETGGQRPLESLKEYLRKSVTSSMLLLIDNLEHLMGATPLLADLLVFAPRLKVLVTSRAALRVQEEHEFVLPPLALPDSKAPHSLSSLAEYPAVALFVQRAAAVKPGFGLTNENASAITEICARLDGLPLAIQLAAARIKLLPPAAIRNRLASRLHLLTSGARDLPARQQTLRHTIDWSYDLLSEAERMLFRRLSVFAGGFTLEAAESACDTQQDLKLDVLDGLSSMVDKSLVRQIEIDGEPRFLMLETIREYGLEKLAASGEETLTCKAHAAYYVILAEDAARENRPNEITAWMDRLETEHDNFRAALDWLIEAKNAEWGVRLATALFRFWEMREYFAEGRRWLEAVLQLPSTQAHDTVRLRALFAAGVLAGNQRDYDASERLFSENLEIARRQHNQQSMAVSLNALAVISRDLGKLDAANELFEESLSLWKQLGDRLAVARELSNLATVRKLQGNFERARELYEECQTIFAELGDRSGTAWAFNHLADLLREQGDLVQARALYECGIGAFREVNDRWGIAGSLVDLGNLTRVQGDYGASEELYRESLRLFQELEHKRGIARVLESFAALASELADAERALRLAGVAAALRESIGAPLTVAEQNKLDSRLKPARTKLSMAAAREAWLEGWVMPVEAAVTEVLRPSG